MTTPSSHQPAPSTTRPLRAMLTSLVALAAVVMQVGCSSPDGPTQIQFAPAQYPAAFDAAKDAVRHFRFPIERVDYVNGEITTDQKTSSGIATPWDAEQSTIENEWEDYTNMQSRAVRISFMPLSETLSPSPETPGTQVTASEFKPVAETQEQVVAQVIVTVTRVNRPGWQPQPKAVRRSGFTEDPELTARRMFPRYEVVVARDEKLAARIVELMRQSLAKVPATASPAETTPETPPETKAARTSEPAPDPAPDPAHAPIAASDADHAGR